LNDDITKNSINNRHRNMNEDSYDDTVKRYYPKYFYCKVDNDKGSKYNNNNHETINYNAPCCYYNKNKSNLLMVQ